VFRTGLRMAECRPGPQDAGASGRRSLGQLTRHQIGAAFLEALRQAGLGVRDLFEGRQEPLSWFFRGLAYDQSELDILESGAVEVLHSPSALVELAVDEMALACANLGVEGVAGYLAVPPAPGTPSGAPPDVVDPSSLLFDPEVHLGWLNLDVAPPALWLEERESDPPSDERLATRLARLAQETGEDADSVEVHIEGALEAEAAWAEAPAGVRPAGVSVYFSFELPRLADEPGERELARVLERGAATAARALEAMRAVFREE